MKFFQLNKTIDAMEAQVVDMGERLHEHQTQIEVMAEALNQKDVAMLEFIGKLHENMGGTRTLKTEDEALARLRTIRAAADRYYAIIDMMRGDYDADAALLKRVACALGTADFESNHIINRAGYLAAAHSREQALKRELDEAGTEIAELEEELEVRGYED
jgi:hypothetical protein